MNPEISHRNTFGYCPTPEEIALAAAALREGWSETRWAKQHGAPKPVEIDMTNRLTFRVERTSGH